MSPQTHIITCQKHALCRDGMHSQGTALPPATSLITICKCKCKCIDKNHIDKNLYTTTICNDLFEKPKTKLKGWRLTKCTQRLAPENKLFGSKRLSPKKNGLISPPSLQMDAKVAIGGYMCLPERVSAVLCCSSVVLSGLVIRIGGTGRKAFTIYIYMEPYSPIAL